MSETSSSRYPAQTPFSPSRRTYGSSQFADIFSMELGGNSTYHGLELELSRQFSQGLYFRGWYSWSKTLNDVLGGRLGDSVGVESQDAYNRSGDKGWQDGVTPQRFRFVAVYEMPFGRGKGIGSGIPGWLNHIVGGYSIAPLMTIGGGWRRMI
jgi:hypothetical protein